MVIQINTSTVYLTPSENSITEFWLGFFASMNNNDTAQELSKLLRTFNSQRVISEGEIKEVLNAIVAILSANKKAVDALADETKQVADRLLEKAAVTLTEQTQTKIKEVLKSLGDDYDRYLASLKSNASLNKEEIQKAVKAQNERAFKRLQDLIDNIQLPENGKDGKDGQSIPGRDGKDGSPDTPTEVRDKLETLKDDERLDWTAIKGLPDYLKMAKRAGKQMLVGGIRFFENLADVSIIPSKKRADLLVQYNTTNNRWENGVAFTVSLTAPSSPQEGDLWVDVN